MRRHPVLRDLSSEHHAGLVMARRAELAAGEAPEVREATWVELVQRFNRELEPHFRREETGLLPALESAGERALAAQIRAEHEAMRRLIAADKVEGLAPFAERLRAHIRFEERVLFPRAEGRLGPAALAALGAGLRADASCRARPLGAPRPGPAHADPRSRPR